MTTHAPTYAPPIRRRVVRPNLDIELVDAATEAYESGEYLDAVHKVFQHILPDQPTDLAQAPITFTQGSARVTAKLDGDALKIDVPLVRLAEGGRAIAALRYVLSKINGTGQLYQARLHGDDVIIEFHEKLSALHPQKLLEVLRRMPAEADRHDDWMVSEFGATALERGTVEPIADDELDHAHAFWTEHWTFVEELLKETQRKRSLFFLNESTSFCLSRVRYQLPLGGSILPRLLESASTFNNTDVDPNKREAAFAKCIKEMKAVGRDELRGNLGQMQYAISPLAEGTSRNISGFFGPGNYMESLDKYRTTGSSIDAGVALIGTYYYLLATHAWPEEVEEELQRGLAEASGKPWREVANLMYEHAQQLVATFCDDDEEEDDDDEDDDEEEDNDE